MDKNLINNWINESDTPVALKWDLDQQTWYESADPWQDYNHTKFERPPLNSVHEIANVEVFVKSGNMSIISFE